MRRMVGWDSAAGASPCHVPPPSPEQRGISEPFPAARRPTSDASISGETAMSASGRPAARATPARPSTGALIRRMVVSLVLSSLVFVTLWLTMFSFVTSLLIGCGFGVVVVVASAASDLFEMVLDAIANVVLAVLAAVAAVLAAVLSLFGN